MFSGRFPPLTANRLGAALAERRREGRPLLDLTETNPTKVGLAFAPDLLAPLADASGFSYDPDPQGLRSARDAVAIDLLRHGIDVDPRHLVLTASTSEAYAFLFKLLCEPGDEVLVPAPSYPLFDHLARLEAVTAAPYPLDPHGGWSTDTGALLQRCTPRTRAILLVNPNNPTGTLLTRGEIDALAAVCRERDLMLIGDEVFADYVFRGGTKDPLAGGAGTGRPFVSVLQQRQCLTASLGGLSKSIGAPQLKLAWIALGGPAPLVDAAVERLSLVGDTFLSVSTPVQRALPWLLAEGRHARERIRARLAANLQALRRRLAAVPACSLLEPDGGWSAVVRVPASRAEEALVLELLDAHDVLVMPGYFYDFPHEAFLVVSLLVAPEVFAAGLERLVEYTQRG